MGSDFLALSLVYKPTQKQQALVQILNSDKLWEFEREDETERKVPCLDQVAQ